MKELSRMSPPRAGHRSGNSSPTRDISFAQAIREVSCERGFAIVSQQTRQAADAGGRAILRRLA